MQQKDLRTYQRRGVTRESGYHTCDETTGGECKVVFSQKYTCESNSTTFVFNRSSLELVELFEKGIGIVAFGGYIYSEKKATISLDLSYCYEGQGYAFGEEWETTVEAESWTNIEAHAEQIINLEDILIDITFKMEVKCPVGNNLHFVGFDFGIITKPEFLDTSCHFAKIVTNSYTPLQTGFERYCSHTGKRIQHDIALVSKMLNEEMRNCGLELSMIGA